METNNTLYATHIVLDEIPSKGLRKLLFYTTPDPNEKQKKYYWGRGMNSYDESHMVKLEEKNKILRLPSPVEIKDSCGLWLDPDGKIYVSDIKAPFNQDKTLPKSIWAPKELSRPVQQYKRDIGTRNVPKANRVVFMP